MIKNGLMLNSIQVSTEQLKAAVTINTDWNWSENSNLLYYFDVEKFEKYKLVEGTRTTI